MTTPDILTFSSLLTDNQAKVSKGEAEGVLTAICHLAPSRMSGFNTCIFATPECAAVCLNESGHAEIFAAADVRETVLPDGRTVRTNSIMRARIARTQLFFRDPDTFLALLVKEIGAHIRKAARLSLIPAVRLNGTSDIRWEDVRMKNGLTIMEMFPDVIFYDYTKHPVRGPLPDNYSLTFSFSGKNLPDALRILENGGNVAVVFTTKKGAPLPETWHGFPVLDADLNDLRFRDPRGHVAGLRPKGRKAARLAAKVAGGAHFIQLGRAS